MFLGDRDKNDCQLPRLHWSVASSIRCSVDVSPHASPHGRSELCHVEASSQTAMKAARHSTTEPMLSLQRIVQSAIPSKSRICVFRMGWISSSSNFYKGRAIGGAEDASRRLSPPSSDTVDHRKDHGGITTINESIQRAEAPAQACNGLGKVDKPQTSTIDPRQLPHFSPEEVLKRNGEACEKLWIVVDKIVYDCSEFVVEHPGGDEVIRSFGGRDCSWQFWRFHGPKDMEEWGAPLRIAKCEEATNPYREPNRWVGLKRLATRDDDW